MSELEPLMSIEEVMALFGWRGKATVFRRIREGKLTPFDRRPGSPTKFRRRDVLAYYDSTNEAQSIAS